MEETGDAAPLDRWLAPDVRRDLEDRLWRPIGAQASLEALVSDPAFLADPGRHPAMFADHGLVHARDVAAGVVRLLDVVHGVLIPGRSPERLAFITALGVATAYVHDIGMFDMSRAGRKAHAVVSAQAAFWPELEPLVAHLLGPGPVRDRLDAVASVDPFAVPVEVIARELLSLCVVHSKSTVPAAALNDRAALRGALRRTVLGAGGDEPFTGHPEPAVAYAWLVATEGTQAELADDAVDAMRVLRAADVLRQRGTGLRTSGGFELSMDADTARAVCTLRSAAGDAAYVITYDDPRGAGEANVREAFLTCRGDLRIAVGRGHFATRDAVRLAATSVAGVVVDIASDVLPSFGGPSSGGGLIAPTSDAAAMLVQVERPDDLPRFAEEVAAEVLALDPTLAGRLVVVADTRSADPEERERFLRATPVDPGGAEADALLARLAEHGADVDGLDRAAAFSEVGTIAIEAGERLVRAGSTPSFVYVPMDEGLVVRPGAGYAPSPLAPWVPVGTTGVVRRQERNGDIVAERAVDVIVIPGEVYTRAWFRPLTPAGLVARLSASSGS